MLAAAEAARSTARDLRAGSRGSIRLGHATATEWQLLPDLLERFGRDRPDVELTVVESYAGTILRELRDGRLDAVVAPSALGSKSDLSRMAVGREAWLVLAGPGHRLAGGSGPVAADELRGETFVVTGHPDGVRRMTAPSPRPSWGSASRPSCSVAGRVPRSSTAWRPARPSR